MKRKTTLVPDVLISVDIGVTRDPELGLGRYLPGILRTVSLKLARPKEGKTEEHLVCLLLLVIFVIVRPRQRIRKRKHAAGVSDVCRMAEPCALLESSVHRTS